MRDENEKRAAADFTRWLEAQKAYQLDAFGLDWDVIGADPERLTQYVTAMLNAMFLEVAEAQQEVPWKPWGTVDRAAVWAKNRDKYVGELVDVLFFAANALGVAGVTDRELAERYAAKMSVNVKRQNDGYTGFENKCGYCGRAVDEPGLRFHVVYSGRQYCDVNHAYLANENHGMTKIIVDSREVNR